MTKAPFNAIVWPFAISQTISWAAMFYLFPAMIAQWQQDLGWSITEISGALTLCLVLSALCAPIAGRIIDKGYFVVLHVGGTVAGIILLLALSQLTALWQFYLVWGAMGIAMSCVLYEPCFAILTRTFDTRARSAITRVTLVAGLAGTIAFPATYYLIGEFGWRQTIVIFAITMLLISVPLAWLASYTAQESTRKAVVKSVDDPKAVARILRMPTFWLLVISYIAFSLDHSMIITHILPLMHERGVSIENAVIAATFIGPMQVAGRIVMLSLEKHTTTIAIASLALLALIISASSLMVANIWAGFVVIFVVLQGAGNGVSSIVRPLLTAEVLGRQNFGVISGIMAIPFIGGFAAGPTISALLRRWHGYDAVLLFAIAISILGIATLYLAAKISQHSK